MNARSFEIIEEAISNGVWTWLELDCYSNSLYLEFERLQLLSKSIVNPFKPVQESTYNDYRGELAIRFGTNIYLAILYDDEDSFDFLDLEEDILNSILNSDAKLSDNDSYFYRQFKKEIRGFKFQDEDYSSNLTKKYKKEIVLAQLPNKKDSYDFLLSFELENFAIIVKGDTISCFNDFESLSDGDIKRASNDWILYYLDYCNKKGTDEAYDEDFLCENLSFD